MQRPKGFTLIELLVVISIIALLVGILLPALGAARKTAISAKCLSNNRQISIGIVSYQNDYQDHFPNKTIRLTSPTGVPLGIAYASWTWVGTAGKNKSVMSGRCGADVRFLNPYIGGPYEDPDAEVPMGVCPGDEQLGDDSYYSSAGTSYRANNTHARSLTRNDRAIWGDDRPGRLATEVLNPSKTIAMVESVALEIVTPATENTHIPVEEVDPKLFFHSGAGDARFNTAFCDGHAAMVTYENEVWSNDQYTMNIDDEAEKQAVEK
jgi:prepilin-type N-terminal cleavage/methylation domain-containing protein/prepilin-type processing-associated H-X9-DG protein